MRSSRDDERGRDRAGCARWLAVGATCLVVLAGCNADPSSAPDDATDAASVDAPDTGHRSDGSPTDGVADTRDAPAPVDGGARDSSAHDSGSTDAALPDAADAGATTFETHCTHAGRTLYVAPAGSDGADGSIAAPWATLTHAASMAAPGDTVVMRGGTYRPTSPQELASVGTAAAWICFEAQPGETPIWDGVAIRDGDVVHVTGQYVVFQGAEVHGARLHGIEVEHARFVDIVDDLVTGSAWAAISVGPSGADMTSTTDVRVHGNRVFDNGLAGSAAPGVSSGNWPAIVRSWGATRVSFTANVVHENYGEGIDFILTDQGEATDNVAFDNYSVNLYLDNASHITVARNLLYWTGTRPAFLRKDSGNAPAGIQMSEEPYGLVNLLAFNDFVDNVIVGCSSGINYGTYGLDRGMTDCTFAGNTIDAGSGGGPTMALGDNAAHKDNRVVDNVLVGGPLWAPAPGAQFQFDHNLFFHVSNAARYAGSGDVIADPRFVGAPAISAEGFQLRADSPAKGAGVALPALAAHGTDFGGRARPSPPSIGAWELP